MAWVKLTDDFTEHPKILDAGALAGWLWVSAIAWSNRNGTDGRIPWAVVPRLASFEGIGVYTGTYTGEDVDARKLAEVLVDVGLFEDVEGGFQIHDYGEYQLTVADLAARSDAKRRAGQAGGKARAEALAKAGGKAGGEAESKPVSRFPFSSSSSANGFGSVPHEVWKLLAERRADRATITGNRANWLAKTAENAKAQEAERAERWWAEFDLAPHQLAEALDVGDQSSVLRYAKRREAG